MKIKPQLSALKSYVGIFLLFLVVVFAAQNAEVVTINFLIWEFSMSRAIMIFLLLLIGFLVGRLYKGMRRTGGSDS